MKHWDGPDPGGTPGRVFTASIGQEPIVQGGPFLSHLGIGLRGTIATTAIGIEVFVDLVAEYDFWVGSDLRLKLDGNDLVALAMAYYGQRPYLGENSDATGSLFLGGIKVPVQQAWDAAKPFSHAATRAAQANLTVETISVTGYWLDDARGMKPVHAVTVTLTSAAATGDDQYSFVLPKVGRLVKLIAAMPAANDFTDANIDVSIQRLKLMRETSPVAEFNALGDNFMGLSGDAILQLPLEDLLARYKVFDLMPEGIDLKESNYTIKIDNEDASDALRFIPVVEIE